MKNQLKSIIISLLLMISSSNIFADYDETYLPKLIVNSDLIFQATIIELDSVNYTVKIDTLIKGSYAKSTIQLSKFEDWTCAQRIRQYEIGQKEIAFAKFNDDSTFIYIIGTGNEGELLQDNDSIIFTDIFYISQNRCNEIKFFEYDWCGWKYEVDEYISSINQFLYHFPENVKNKEYINTIDYYSDSCSLYNRILYLSKRCYFD